MENLFLEKVTRNLLESRHFLKVGKKRSEKKVGAKIKFIIKIIYPFFFMENNIFPFKIVNILFLNAKLSIFPEV